MKVNFEITTYRNLQDYIYPFIMKKKIMNHFSIFVMLLEPLFSTFINTIIIYCNNIMYN